MQIDEYGDSSLILPRELPPWLPLPVAGEDLPRLLSQKIFDRVRDTSTTTGAGPITLAGSPPLGYQSFASVLNTLDETWYCAANQIANEWEVGLAILTSPTTLTRQQVFSSSNSGALVNFSAGTKDVFVTVPAVTLSKTVGFVTGANSPYTALPSDDLIEFLEDVGNDPAGVSLQLVMYGFPYIGQKLTAVWWTTQAGAPPPRITGNNNIGVEDVNTPGYVMPAGSNTSLRSPYQRATWEFDGTQWIILP